MTKCNCDCKTPSTRLYVLLGIGFFMVALALWGMDWSFTHQANGQNIDILGCSLAPSYWWNINWAILFMGILTVFVSAIKIGYLKCRGEL
jgi:hypothetical protein